MANIKLISGGRIYSFTPHPGLEENSDNLAVLHADELRIDYDPDIPSALLTETILHEVAHIADIEGRCGILKALDDEDEERGIFDNFTNRLFGLLVQNPWLTRRILDQAEGRGER